MADGTEIHEPVFVQPCGLYSIEVYAADERNMIYGKTDVVRARTTVYQRLKKYHFNVKNLHKTKGELVTMMG